MPSPSRTQPSDQRPPPVRLTDEQMSAILAASHPLPPDVRGAFLETCARELAGLSEIGDGTVHRVVMVVQRRYFDPPDNTGWEIGQRDHATKLTTAAPISA
jgi:hypothetical protein